MGFEHAARGQPAGRRIGEQGVSRLSDPLKVRENGVASAGAPAELKRGEGSYARTQGRKRQRGREHPNNSEKRLRDHGRFA
jgi:hypothetical protein